MEISREFLLKLAEGSDYPVSKEDVAVLTSWIRELRRENYRLNKAVGWLADQCVDCLDAAEDASRQDDIDEWRHLGGTDWQEIAKKETATLNSTELLILGEVN